MIHISLKKESTKFAKNVVLFRVLSWSSRTLSLIHLTEWILHLIQSGCIDWSRRPTRPSLITACRSKVLLKRRSQCTWESFWLVTRSWPLPNFDRSTWIFTTSFELKDFFLNFRSSDVSASTPFSSFKMTTSFSWDNRMMWWSFKALSYNDSFILFFKYSVYAFSMRIILKKLWNRRANRQESLICLFICGGSIEILWSLVDSFNDFGSRTKFGYDEILVTKMHE